MWSEWIALDECQFYSPTATKVTAASHLARVEGLAEPDVDVVLEEVGVALDALRQRRRRRRRHRVVEQAVEVHVVHALNEIRNRPIHYRAPQKGSS